jgi:hypothetical protein
VVGDPRVDIISDPIEPASGDFQDRDAHLGLPSAISVQVSKQPQTERPDDGSSTKDVAKDQASNVAGSAVGAGQQVAGVAKDQASNVAAEAAGQAKDVLGQARTELSQQAAQQQQRVAGGLRSIGSELGSMADRSEEPGVASDLARQASSTVHEVADWLEQRDPSGLLDEVTSFARRRPGAFLAIALGAGLAAGRLTRGLKDDSSSSTGRTGSTSGSTGQQSTGQYATGQYATGQYGTGQQTTGQYGTGQYAGTGTGYQEPTPAYAAPAVAEPVTVVETTEYVEPAYPVSEPTYPEGSTGTETPVYPTDPTYRNEENR